MAIYDDTQIETLLKVFPALSATEAKVFALYSSGITAKEIAQKFNISIKTVNSHINNTQKKYDVNSFYELRTVYMCQSMLVVMRTFTGIRDFFPELTNNELAAYELYAIGHSNRSIANRLGLELGAVDSVISSIRNKLKLDSLENLRSAFLYKMTFYAMSRWG